MKIHQLLKSKKKWTQRVLARNKLGRKVDSYSSKAVCWCLLSALSKCYLGPERDRVESLLRSQPEISRSGIIGWNDEPNRTHAEVLELVTRLDV